MRYWIVLFVAAVCLAQDRAPGNETILRDQLKADLFFLASDSLRGRLTGDAEDRIAAEFVAARFERLGLKPMGEAKTFFHRFDLVLSRLAEGNALSIGNYGSAAPSLEHSGVVREDFYPVHFSPNARASAPVVFAGFGVRAPDLGRDDYGGQPVAGRIVLLLDGEPGADDPASPFDGVVTSEHANAFRKALAAQELGAEGVLFVNPKQSGKLTDGFPSAGQSYWPDEPPHLERYTLAADARRLRIPVMQISPAFAALLMGSAKVDLEEAARQAETGPQRTELGQSRVSMTVRLQHKIVEDRSAVAYLEGSDPNLKDEAVLISSHHDHNGTDGTQIYAGADDNGSGTVALMEIAEAYMAAAAQGQLPKRSVIFAAWGAEERCCGPLLGSWAWVRDPGWPLERTVAVLNMDMIGRSEEVPASGGPRFRGLAPQTAESNANAVNLLGWSYSPQLSALADEANRSYDLTLRRRYDNNRSNLLRRSDQWPFLQSGVPALFVHTGLHPDYHTTNDRPERIEYDKLERIARFVHNLSWMLANQSGRPAMPARRTIPSE